MKTTTKTKLSIVLNAIILLTTIGVVISYFFGNDGKYHIEPLFRFNLFTTDSNLLCAAAAAFMIPFEIRLLKKGTPVPRWVFLVKYVGTCAVTLTFFTVVCFLGPMMGFMDMVFGGTSIYMHFFGPILGFVSFCFLETSQPISLPTSLIGLIPMLVYGGVYCYMVVILTAERGGWIDFYQFNQGGYWYISFAVIMAAMFGFCSVIRLVHNRIAARSQKTP